MILIDSSSWIHLLRQRGDVIVCERVVAALQSGRACWCAQVRLELWNGAGGTQEKKVLRDFERQLPDLAITDAVWALACEIARKARVAGITVASTDVLIAACARHHRVELEHCDSDFELLRKLDS